MKKITVSFVLYLIFTCCLNGQTINSSIFLTGEKDNIDHCGEMKIISITPHATDPYKSITFAVTIDDDIFPTTQNFFNAGLTNDYFFYFQNENYENIWCNENNSSSQCFDISIIDSETIDVDSKAIELTTFNAQDFKETYNSFTFFMVENFGLLPFEELIQNNYSNFNITGIKKNDVYYPITSDLCEPQNIELPLHPHRERVSSAHLTNMATSIKYAYNKYGGLLSFHYSTDCRLEIYEHLENKENLLYDLNDVTNLTLDTDQFFSKNIAVAAFTNKANRFINLTILKHQDEYVIHSNETQTPSIGISALNEWSYLLFEAGRIVIKNSIGSEQFSISVPGHFTNGYEIPNDLFALYSSATKTIYLYDKNGNQIQDFSPIFVNIDGFKIFDGNFITWKGNQLSVHNFHNNTTTILDNHADISSLIIFDNEVIWKRRNLSTFIKFSFQDKTFPITETVNFDGILQHSHFHYWNKNIKINAGQNLLSIENVSIPESFVFQSTETPESYDLSLDSLTASILTQNGSVTKYRFEYKITNNGDRDISKILFNGLDRSNLSCSRPILADEIDMIASGTTEIGHFNLNVTDIKDFCFYIFAPNETGDGNFEDNYKCFTYGVTDTDDVQEINLKAYPNPVTNMLYLDNYEGNIMIYDIYGKLIYNDFVSTQIDVSFLPSGLYILNTNNGQSMKIVKN